MAKLRHCIQLIGWIFLPGYWSWWFSSVCVCVYFSCCLQAVFPEGASSWFVHWDPASVHISMSTAWWKSWSYTWWLWSYSLVIMIMIIYCDWYHDQPRWLWWKTVDHVHQDPTCRCSPELTMNKNLPSMFRAFLGNTVIFLGEEGFRVKLYFSAKMPSPRVTCPWLLRNTSLCKFGFLPYRCNKVIPRFILSYKYSFSHKSDIEQLKMPEKNQVLSKEVKTWVATWISSG